MRLAPTDPAWSWKCPDLRCSVGGGLHLHSCQSTFHRRSSSPAIACGSHVDGARPDLSRRRSGVAGDRFPPAPSANPRLDLFFAGRRRGGSSSTISAPANVLTGSTTATTGSSERHEIFIFISGDTAAFVDGRAMLEVGSRAMRPRPILRREVLADLRRARGLLSSSILLRQKLPTSPPESITRGHSGEMASDGLPQADSNPRGCRRTPLRFKTVNMEMRRPPARTIGADAVSVPHSLG